MQKSIGLGDKLDLVKVDESLNDDKKKNKVYSSKVLDFRTSDTLQISMPIYEGRVVPLSVGDKYEACFYTKKGLLECKVVVVDRYKQGTLFILDVSPISSLKKIQRREYFRMDFRIGAEYRLVPPTEKKPLTDEELEVVEWKKSAVIDLSGGGLRMLSRERDNKGDFIQIKFIFPAESGPIRFVLFGNIVRAITYEQNNNLYDIRIEFTNIGDSEREKLIRCIFEEERRKLSQAKV